MSEQALKAPPSGTSSVTGTAVTGTYRVVTDGKPDPSIGKKLPEVAVEKPDLEQLAQKLNTANRRIGRDLRFQVDMERGNAVLQVIDSETGELIRQIPQEKAASALQNTGASSFRLIDALI